jgi:DNA-binding response OmpR family regulator
MTRTLLIAEDNPELLEVLSLQFDWRGFRVLRARDGAEALRQVEEQRPELLLLDVVMPFRNGFEVCRAVKSDPRHRTLPVILFSGRRGRGDRDWGLECGADAYLTKPFAIGSLQNEVDRLLSRAPGASAPGRESPAPRTVCRWSLDPEAARGFRHRYGELAYRRLMRELPEVLGRRLASWGVIGWVRRESYGSVVLEVPGHRARVEACLPHLTASGDAYLRSLYEEADQERGELRLEGRAGGGAERRFPLLRLRAAVEPDGEPTP